MIPRLCNYCSDLVIKATYRPEKDGIGIKALACGLDPELKLKKYEIMFSGNLAQVHPIEPPDGCPRRREQADG